MDTTKGLDFYSKRVDDTFKHLWQGGSKWISIWILRFMARDKRFRSRGLDKSLMRLSCYNHRHSLPQNIYIHIHIYFFHFFEIYGMKQNCRIDREKKKRKRCNASRICMRIELVVCAGCEIFFCLYSYIEQEKILGMRILFYITYFYLMNFLVSSR